jgi:hypothetical protein
MIEHKMLQVEQTSSDDSKPGRRSSRKIAEELSSMVHKCQNQKSYYSAKQDVNEVQPPHKRPPLPTKHVGFVEDSKLDTILTSHDVGDVAVVA